MFEKNCLTQRRKDAKFSFFILRELGAFARESKNLHKSPSFQHVMVENDLALPILHDDLIHIFCCGYNVAKFVYITLGLLWKP